MTPPELLPGELAPTGGDAQPAPKPLRLRDTGRMPPRASTWAKPLPPLLWERVDEETRAAHLRVVERFEQLVAKAADTKVAAKRAEGADEAALRNAVTQGKAPPRAKAPKLAEAAEEAKRMAEAAGRMLADSATGLLDGLTDQDLAAAVAQAQDEARAAVDAVPGLVDELQGLLARSAAAGGEAGWCGVLLERRWTTPYAAHPQPLTGQLAEASRAADQLKQCVVRELEERDRRGKPAPRRPLDHGFAPAPNSWPSGAAQGFQQGEGSE